MIFCLQIVIALMGVVSVGLAVRYVVFFAASDHHAARSMKWLLLEQITSSVGTLAFSSHSLYHTLAGTPEEQWNAMATEIAIAIRFVMFAMMIHATANISWSIRKILEDEGQR